MNLRAAMVVGLCACHGSSSNPPPVDAPAVPIDAPTGDGQVTISADVSGTVSEQTTGDPIGGAQICAEGSDVCTTSASDGTYDFDVSLPEGMSLLDQVTTATGYLGRETLLDEDPGSNNDYQVFWQNFGGLYATAAATTLLATQAGFTYPSPTTGFVRVFVSGASDDMVAATATISPSGGSGPVYTNASGDPDPAVTDTSTGGDFYFGNLPPGTYALTIQAAGMTCTSFDGGSTINGEWPPAGGETLRIHVSPGAMTTGVGVECQ
ncbi:MAG TPA: carboxypeptidase-like regulatory domain-containing protein [Kofleriaceae bacterium]|jgi:hypothetical protein